MPAVDGRRPSYLPVGRGSITRLVITHLHDNNSLHCLGARPQPSLPATLVLVTKWVRDPRGGSRWLLVGWGGWQFRTSEEQTTEYLVLEGSGCLPRFLEVFIQVGAHMGWWKGACLRGAGAWRIQAGQE